MTQPLSLEKLAELFEAIDNQPTAKLSELAEIAGLNLAEDYIGADLSGEDLSEDDLSGANFSNANLSGTNLSGTNLSGANLFGTNLSNANLSNANLSNANLSNANLSNANLIGTIIEEALHSYKFSPLPTYQPRNDSEKAIYNAALLAVLAELDKKKLYGYQIPDISLYQLSQEAADQKRQELLTAGIVVPTAITAVLASFAAQFWVVLRDLRPRAN